MSGQGEMEVETDEDEDALFGRSDEEEELEKDHEAERAGGGPPGAAEDQAEQVPDGVPHPSEAREPVVLSNPIKPSAEEVEKH